MGKLFYNIIYEGYFNYDLNLLFEKEKNEFWRIFTNF